MSVLACDRYGCTNVMCDRFSHRHQWYLCNDCFDELVRLGPKINLDEFMDNKVSGDHEDASRAYFNEIFPLRHPEST